MQANRIAHTYVPFNLDSNSQEVFAFWTDNKSNARKGMVPLTDLVITYPKQKGQHVMVLEGEHSGETAIVERYTKGKCHLKKSETKWIQAKETLCVIVPHTDDGRTERCICAL